MGSLCAVSPFPSLFFFFFRPFGSSGLGTTIPPSYGYGMGSSDLSSLGGLQQQLGGLGGGMTSSLLGSSNFGGMNQQFGSSNLDAMRTWGSSNLGLGGGIGFGGIPQQQQQQQQFLQQQQQLGSGISGGMMGMGSDFGGISSSLPNLTGGGLNTLGGGINSFGGSPFGGIGSF